MKVAVCLGLAVLALSGCFTRNTTPEFVPTCDADAPSHYDLEVWNSDRVSPTMEAFETKGWVNITTQEHDMELFVTVVSGDCQPGQGAAVTIDPAKYEIHKGPGTLTGTVFGVVLMIGLGAMAYGISRSVWWGLFGTVAGVAGAYAFGLFGAAQVFAFVTIGSVFLYFWFREGGKDVQA